MLEKGMTEKYITALTRCAKHNIGGYKLIAGHGGTYTEKLIKNGIFLFKTSHKYDEGYYIQVYIVKSRMISNAMFAKKWCFDSFSNLATMVEMIYEERPQEGKIDCIEFAGKDIHTYIFEKLDNSIELYDLYKEEEKKKELEKERKEKSKRDGEDIKRSVKMFNRYCRNK